MVIGTVVGIHIDDAVVVDGKVDNAIRFVRLGYMDYARVTKAFRMA